MTEWDDNWKRAAGAAERGAAPAERGAAAAERGAAGAAERGAAAAERGAAGAAERGAAGAKERGASRGEQPSALPGLRILDFSRVLAGPFATMVLADLGAEVLKVERPGVGDDTRAWGPPWDERGQSTYFDSVNRNKRSIAIDLATPEGLASARALAASADVLVENFRPGLLDGLGLGYAELRDANPGLIYCSITGFGSTDAGAALPGYDLLVQALGGLMSITGDSGGEPQKVGVALVDVLAGLYSTVGILAALNHRGATGEGQLIEVNLFSALLASLVNQASSYTVAGVVPGRMGNEHPSITPYADFETGDGRLVLAVGTDRQFQSLCEVIGAPALAQDERFATNPDRVSNRDDLRADLEVLLRARPAVEWAARLTEARVPAGVVNDIASAFSLAQALGLDPLVEIPAGDGASIRLPRNPIRMSRTPPSYHSPPPELPG